MRRCRDVSTWILILKVNIALCLDKRELYLMCVAVFCLSRIQVCCLVSVLFNFLFTLSDNSHISTFPPAFSSVHIRSQLLLENRTPVRGMQQIGFGLSLSAGFFLQLKIILNAINLSHTPADKVQHHGQHFTTWIIMLDVIERLVNCSWLLFGGE